LLKLELSNRWQYTIMIIVMLSLPS
jgi:hypothetical protein